MKRCPQCGNIYTDEEEKYCLKDGTPLVKFSWPTSQAETLQVKGAAKSPQVMELPFQSTSGIYTINTPVNAIVLGVYLRPAPPLMSCDPTSASGSQKVPMRASGRGASYLPGKETRFGASIFPVSCQNTAICYTSLKSVLNISMRTALIFKLKVKQQKGI